MRLPSLPPVGGGRGGVRTPAEEQCCVSHSYKPDAAATDQSVNQTSMVCNPKYGRLGRRKEKKQ